MKALDLTKLSKILTKNKYVWLVLALGLFLLLLPGRTGQSTPETVPERAVGVGDALPSSGIPLDTESERLAALLSEIKGVGDASVLLSGSGAVVVCSGGDSPTARYLVTNAVSAYTGLGSDKITVMKMK